MLTLEKWVESKDFWKSDEEDWREIWDLLEAQLKDGDAVGEVLDSVIGLASAEYGE